MSKISEEQFTEMLQPRLGILFDRALIIFRNYGEHLSYDVTNVLLYANTRMTYEVFDALEKHYKDHLQFQHPEIRGTIEDRLLGVNPTQMMFRRICEQTLKLQPV